MTVYSQQVALPSGYNDPAGGPYHPPVATLLFPARDCDSTVRLSTSSSYVTIGGSDVGNGSWPLAVSQEHVFVLPANEQLYGIFNESTSNTTPNLAYVLVLVIELAP